MNYQDILSNIKNIIADAFLAKLASSGVDLEAFTVDMFSDLTSKDAQKKLKKISKTTISVNTAIEVLQEALSALDVEALQKLIPKQTKTTKEFKPVDPEAPKKPASAYILFSKDKRAEAKEELGEDAKPVDVTKHLGEMWNKEKSVESKTYKKYQKQYEKAKKEYDQKMESYERPSDEELMELEENKKKHKNYMKRKDSASKPKKAKKNPDEPKGAKSSYVFFCDDHRAKAVEELKKAVEDGELDASEVLTSKGSVMPKLVMKRLGEMWKELDNNKKGQKLKKTYEQKALEDKQRYTEDVEKYKEDHPEFVGRSSSKGKKVVGPRSAYVLFASDKRAGFKAENPDATAAEISKMLGEAWKVLKNKEKKIYVQKEQEDIEAFQKRLEEAGLTEEEWNDQKKEAKEAKARRKAEKNSEEENEEQEKNEEEEKPKKSSSKKSKKSSKKSKKDEEESDE